MGRKREIAYLRKQIEVSSIFTKLFEVNHKKYDIYLNSFVNMLFTYFNFHRNVIYYYYIFKTKCMDSSR